MPRRKRPDGVSCIVPGDSLAQRRSGRIITRGGPTMTIDRSFVAQNDAERARLEKLVGRLSDGDLQRPLPAGWTVAGVLTHLAFWDQRAFLLLDRWQKDGKTPPANAEEDVDWINDAAKPMFLALP